MSDPVATEPVLAPRWMYLRGHEPAKSDVDELTRSYRAGDPRNSVAADKLPGLFSKGWLPLKNYYFTVTGVGADLPPRLRAAKLGNDLHTVVRKDPNLSDGQLDELDALRNAIGGTGDWRDSPGFPAFIAYLSRLAEFKNTTLDAYRFVGEPGTPLIGRAQATPAQSAAARDARAIGQALSPFIEQLQRDLGEHNVIVEGVAGSGKSYLVKELRALYGAENVELIVFHPSTSYEEFVAGIRPTAEGGFEGRAGVFVELCERAAGDPDNNYLLFIDEINRANTSRVFGDLMLPLERSKRYRFSAGTDVGALQARRPDLSDQPGAEVVRLQTAIDSPADDKGGGGASRLSYLVVPANLHVLGTMNSTDRSVGTVDLALRRRFRWLVMKPLDREELEDKLADKRAQHGDWDPLITWYSNTNDWLQTVLGPDARLGHSYFFEAAVPEAAADLLLTQLGEVLHMFHAAPEVVQAVPSLDIGAHARTIKYVGIGLGRRPAVVVLPRFEAPSVTETSEPAVPSAS